MNSGVALKYPYAAAVAGVFLLFRADGAFPQETGTVTLPDDVIKVRTEGFCPGTGIRARSLAVTDAEKDAIRLWIKSVIGETSPVLVRPVLSDPAPYLLMSRPTAYARVDGGTRATVEVFIRQRALKHALASLMIQQRDLKPAVVLLLRETVTGGPPASIHDVGVAETTLYSALARSAFRAVPPETARANYTEGELHARAQGDAYLMGRYGRETEADVAVIGEARAFHVPGTETGNVSKVKAELTLNVVRAADGELFDTLKSEASVSSVDLAEGARLALRDAAYKLREDVLVAAILASRQPAGSQAVVLRIEEPRGPHTVNAVRDRIAEDRSAGPVEILRMTQRLAMLRFKYSGDVGELVRRLRLPFDGGWELKPLQVIDTDMTFRMTRVQPSASFALD